ncbi:MAG: thiol:disulfide interchange protein DsbA/DsbL [Pseudomonadota bacterium]
MNLRRHLTALLLLLPLAASAVPYAATEQNAREFLPGRDYTVLATPLPTTTGDRIEVREFFFYGCSHCFDLERHVTAWLQTKAADVELVRTPAMLNPKWAPLGRAYYVAEELKVLEKIHAPLYNALHVGREKLYEQGPIISFFVRMGVPKEQTEAAWNSFAVTTKVRNADQLARKYMVSGTPTLAVAGKYVVPASGDRTFAIVDFLVNKERAARGRK